MTALAQLQNVLADLAERLGLEVDACRPPMAPRPDGFHLIPRGDRFDLVQDAAQARREEGLGLDDAAYEVVFAAALVWVQADAAAKGDGALSRWNWMGAHIALLDRVGPHWGEKARAHYRRILSAAPLTDSEIAAIRPGLLRPDSHSR